MAKMRPDQRTCQTAQGNAHGASILYREQEQWVSTFHKALILYCSFSCCGDPQPSNHVSCYFITVICFCCELECQCLCFLRVLGGLCERGIQPPRIFWPTDWSHCLKLLWCKALSFFLDFLKWWVLREDCFDFSNTGFLWRPQFLIVFYS